MGGLGSGWDAEEATEQATAARETSLNKLRISISLGKSPPWTPTFFGHAIPSKVDAAFEILFPDSRVDP